MVDCITKPNLQRGQAPGQPSMAGPALGVASLLRVMKATVLMLLLALALIVVADASASNPPKSPAATAAFAGLLHQRYGETNGFWACPSVSEVAGTRIDCLAEIRAGHTWHQVSALVSVRDGRVVMSQVVDTAWIRHWWPFSRHFILRSNEPQVSGVISVNSPAYDWGFLAECVARHVRRCSAYDGNAAGLARMFLFRCTDPADIVTCTNSLGDSVRYRPRP